MNYKKVFGNLLIISSFTGCITTTSSTLKYAHDNYQNKNIDELIMAVGIPQNQYKMQNGDILYKWVYSGTLNMPITTIQNGSARVSNLGNMSTIHSSSTSTTYGGISNRVCDMSVLATKDNKIKMIKFNKDTMGTEALTASMCAQMFGIN